VKIVASEGKMTAIQPNVSEPVSDELALVQAAKGVM